MGNRLNTLREMIKERIIILDGAMGTSIQKYDLKADDYGGEKYDGCTDYLTVTQPKIIENIHDDFLKSGADIIETNTFGANGVVLSEYGLEDRVREINKEAVNIAKKSISKFSDKFIAGSMGPTSKSICVTGGIDFDGMTEAYYQQALGLIEGGCDLLLIETGQDTLNMKAGYVAVDKARKEIGRDVPVMFSATILLNGTMLAGQNIEAFYTSISHAKPFAVGMNCAMGPAEMKDHIQALSEINEYYSIIFPNAGLPDESGGYSETPESFAKQIETYGKKGWLNIVGGCCGTTPEHIRLVKEITSSIKPRVIKPVSKTFSASGIENIVPDPNVKPMLIGERTNVQGSRKFKRLITNKDYDTALGIAKQQVEKGASIIDVCVEDTAFDEIEAINEFYPKLTKAVKVPIMIDSTSPSAVETALKHCQGKAVLNSINLEGGKAQLEKIIPILKKYGVATVVGAIDEEGMAITYEKKVSTAKKLYKLLTEEFDMSPQDLIFDLLVFTMDTGENPTYRGSAEATIKALKTFKTEYPEVPTILGVSNCSFGLPKAGREVLNAVYLYHCVQSGLDMAIVNPAMLKRYTGISEEEITLCEDLIFNKNEDALSNFIEYYRGKKPAKFDDADLEKLTPEEAVERAVLTGNKTNVENNIKTLLEKYKPMDIINNFLMKGMDEVGVLFGQGKLIVTEVLQSAEVMKFAVSILEPLMKSSDKKAKKKILLATVKGDVHDIGKNLVNIILSSNGYEVIDIGTKVDPHTLIESAKEVNPDAIGLSGLLVKSAKQMVITAEDLARENISVPILIGGAALNEAFVKKEIQAVYNGKVYYSQNAMDGLSILKQVLKS